MYLLYLDESGDTQDQKCSHFVLGGVAIYENQAYYLSQALDEIQDRWFPGVDGSIEFHSAEIMNHRGEPWKTLGRHNCEKLLCELCDTLLSVSEKGITLFAVVVQKDSFPSDDPLVKAFHEICGHFDNFIHNRNMSGDSETKNRGLIVLDSARYRGQLDTLLREYRKTGGTKFGRVKNFADVPAFADSKATRLLQAADLVAYSVFRRYERSDARLFDRLIKGFQQSGTVIHGLMHMVARHWECCCPACVSRRFKE